MAVCGKIMLDGKALGFQSCGQDVLKIAQVTGHSSKGKQLL